MSRQLFNKTRLLLLAFVMVVLTACGQKGELYLPDESRTELDISTRLT